MKKTLFLPALMMLSVAVSAAPVIFPEHNCSIEAPAGWKPLNPVPPHVLAVFYNADGSKSLSLKVEEFADAQRSMTDPIALKSIKWGMNKAGWQLFSEDHGTIQGLPSAVFAGHLASGATVTFHMVGVGETMYTIQAILPPGVAVATDAEVQAAVQSFKFLKPVPTLPDDISLNSIGSHAFTFIVMLTLLAIAIGVLVLVVVGVVVVLRRAGFIKPKA